MTERTSWISCWGMAPVWTICRAIWGWSGWPERWTRRAIPRPGAPAPIPGPAELKAAIIAAAFQAHQGDQPQLTEVQTPSTGGSAYYALAVESVIPPGVKPYDAVKDQVAEDWKQDQRRRFQDQAATAMMTAVQGGKSFSDAATVAGVTPKLEPAGDPQPGQPGDPAGPATDHVRLETA